MKEKEEIALEALGRSLGTVVDLGELVLEEPSPEELERSNGVIGVSDGCDNIVWGN